MLVLRFFVWLVSLLSFGFVSLGTVTYGLVDEGENFDQTITFEEYLIANDIEKSITLTNLIQNGQMDNTSIWTNQGTLVFISNEKMNFVNDGIDSYTKQENIQTIGLNYYRSFTISNYVSGGIYQVGSGGTVYSSDGFKSGIFTAIATNYVLDDLINDAVLSIDDVSLFNSSTYSKTQIDTALSNYGYLPYNVATSMYDETDLDFQDAYAEFFGSYEDFVIEDLGEFGYVDYSVDINDDLSIGDISVLILFIICWVLIIRFIGGILYVRFNS